jgi:microcystin-dependent protein
MPNASAILGEIRMSAAVAVQTGWLLCFGQAVSRTTYAALWGVLNPQIGNCTISNATPGIITKAAHGLLDGQTIYFTTTGGLPAGLSINTRYWVTKINADTFKVSTSPSNFISLVYVATSSDGSGVHTLWRSPWGVGDGSTTFTLPDFRGTVGVGADDMGGVASGNIVPGFAPNAFTSSLGGTGGESLHVLVESELPGHSHLVNVNSMGVSVVAGNNAVQGTLDASDATQESGTDGSDVPHNNLQPFAFVNYMIFAGA